MFNPLEHNRFLDNIDARLELRELRVGYPLIWVDTDSLVVPERPTHRHGQYVRVSTSLLPTRPQVLASCERW